MANILVFDNYDSFTYNLVHYVRKAGGHNVDVFRNDEIALDDVEKYDGIILSPGPGIPEEAGLLLPLIRRYYKTKRIFGVCLGQQAIAEAFGGTLINLETVFHGVASTINVSTPNHYIFNGLPQRVEVGRYHSWVVSKETLPACLTINAEDENGDIMALSHTEYDVCGVQFHPESVLTPQGFEMIKNWLDRF
jgi:anthranilate synthase component II